MEALRRTDIGIYITCSSLRSLERAIAESPSRWFRIAGRAYVLISREGPVVHDGMATEGLHLRHVAVRTRSTATCVRGVGCFVDGQRKAAMNRDDGGTLPAAYHRIENRVHIAANRLTSANRQLISTVGSKNVPGVKVATRIIGMRIVEVLVI